MVKPPPHQRLDKADWNRTEDAGGYFPTPESAQDYAAGIVSHTYHQDRLRALRYLLDRLPAVSTVLDYGIADGGEFLGMGLGARRVIGTDISPHMIDIAREKLSGLEFTGLVGSVEVLRDLADELVDLVLCINVLGYLTEAEQDTFFRESHRVLKPGGHMVVMTGNELFDLFALNSGTADFFGKHFDQKADELLTHAKADRFRNASRSNPLNFGAHVARYGFTEVAQSFSQWHRQIPTLANIEHNGDLHKAYHAARDHSFDPNQLSPADRWKALFRCSMFASLSRK